MSKIDDMALFVRIVKAGGLAAAGRQVGLSPASMTARMNALEQRYQTRLLQRSTRRIALTDAGQRFYQACLRVLDEVEQAEALLQDNTQLSGPLRITAPSDFGRQYVTPALAAFVQQHPEVRPYLHLTDAVENLIEQGFDLGVRFGNLPDSSLIVKRLSANRRVLVAAPDYLAAHGTPDNPEALRQHRCLVLERLGEPLLEWQFFDPQGARKTVKVSAALTSNDGEVIRSWALAGQGIAFKSIWDVQQDIASGCLCSLLDQQVLGFQPGDSEQNGLQIVYPNRRYLPTQVSGFIEFFAERLHESAL